MESLFSINAYYTLGLPTTADQGEIKKKARMINAQLGIGENKLETDFPHIKINRTEDSLRDAVQKLSNPLKKVQEVYFWYADEGEQELAKTISDGYLDEAYTFLGKRAEKAGKWNDKRNLAIFLTQLLQYKKTNKKYLEEVLELWKDLTTSESAWKYFELYYKNIDDLSTDESAFTSLRKYVDQVVSDTFSELSHKWEDNDYTQLYTKAFGRVGAIAQKNVFEPNAKKINDAATKLTAIKWTEGIPSKDNIRDIKESIGNIQNALNLLIENGIYEGSESLALRDKAAEAIRGVGIKLHNDYSDYEKAGSVIEIADKIAGTTSLRSQLGEDKSSVKTFQNAESVILPILELTKKQQFTQALQLIEKSIKDHEGNRDILEVLKQNKRGVISGYAVERHSEGLAKLKSNNYAACKQILSDLQEFLLKELDMFNFKREGLESIKNTIEEGTTRINKAQVDVLDNYRTKLVQDGQQTFGETHEATIFIILVDTYLYVPLCDYFKKLYGQNQLANGLIQLGYWTLLIYGVGLIPLLIGYYVKGREVVYVRE